MPGSANASAAIIPGSDPDHTSDPKVAVTRGARRQQRGRNHDHSPNHAANDRRTDHRRATNRAAGRIHGARRERLAAERTTDILRIVVAKRRERRLRPPPARDDLPDGWTGRPSPRRTAGHRQTPAHRAAPRNLARAPAAGPARPRRAPHRAHDKAAESNHNRAHGHQWDSRAACPS